MILGQTIYTIDSHTGGMPTRIVMGGVPDLLGKTMIEKARFFRDHYDYIRTALFREPRGLMRGIGAIMTSPVNPQSHFGVIFMDGRYEWLSMCGAGTIGVVTAAIELGLVQPCEPITEVVLDTLAGQVKAFAKVASGAVEAVTIQNVPSFLSQSCILNVPNIGKIPVDIGFGGLFYVIVEAGSVGVSLERRRVVEASSIALAIKDAANAQIQAAHPVEAITGIEAARLFQWPDEPQGVMENLVIFGQGDYGIDRSPCGSGSSAHLGVLYSQGRIELNRDYIQKSIIGTTFTSRVVEVTKVGNYDAVVPEITGSAYTMGMNTHVLSPNDPLRYGFLLTE